MNADRIIAVRNNKTVYRDGERVLKVFDETYSKADVLNEALNQARVEETGLNIPRILEVTVIDGNWTIVSQYIKGKTLARLMEENPDRKDEYLNLFVDLQLEMHSKVCPGLNKLKDKLSHKINETDLPATVRYDLQTRLEQCQNTTKFATVILTRPISSLPRTVRRISWTGLMRPRATPPPTLQGLIFYSG